MYIRFFFSFFVRRISLITISTYGENCILRAYRAASACPHHLHSLQRLFLATSDCLSVRYAIIFHETANFSEIAEATNTIHWAPETVLLIWRKKLLRSVGQ